ncbi:MAG: type II toxin-antitoxin system PemK/MazF family toxin [Deltaproteobacteria bacterium]|nr:type II toxin-antitoxin system PemK/MazF family toxin [Deltaproteobacteria bacterium]
MKIKRGFLYLADLNPRFGTEPGKSRPVIVIQTDLLNGVDHPSTWILPCTTHLTEENLLRVRLPQGCAGNEKECDVMVDQSRSIDNKRFQQQLKRLPDILFEEIIEKLKQVGEL